MPFRRERRVDPYSFLPGTTGLEVDVRTLGEGLAQAALLLEHDAHLAAPPLFRVEGRVRLEVDLVLLDVLEDPVAVAAQAYVDRQVVVTRRNGAFEDLEFLALVDRPGRVGLRELALAVQKVGDGLHSIGVPQLVDVPDGRVGARRGPLDDHLFEELERGLGAENALLEAVDLLLNGAHLPVELGAAARALLA